MLGTLTQNDGRHAPHAFTLKKRATAEEIQADLQERIDRLVARDAKFKGCSAARPRLVPQRHDAAPNWTVDGFPGAEPLAQADIFTLDVDILIPAALENQITIDNAPRIKAKVIVEGANGPTTPDAHKYLHEHGMFVVPDILANSSGVTTSYFEWVQDRYGYFWTEKEVNERLEAKMCEAFNAVLQTALKYKVDMRTAAYIVAIGRVATVTRMRGMYA